MSLVSFLLIECPFTKLAWEEAIKLTCERGKRKGNPILDDIDIYFKDILVKDHKSLSCIVLCAISLRRNGMKFQNTDLSPKH